MTAPMEHKGYRKYAWVLIALGGLLDVYGTISYMAQNGWVLPTLDWVFGGLVTLGGIIQVVVGPTAFRKRTKWGWYLVLFAALASLLNGVYDSIVASPFLGFVLYIFYGGPALSGLLLTYRKFFPKKPVIRAALG